MKNQLLIIAIVFLFLTVELSGCEQESDRLIVEKNKFVGTWINNTTTVETLITTIINFFSNGTCQYDIVSGTWDLKDDKLVIVFSNGYSRTYDYVFLNNDKTLSLTSPPGSIPKVFTKQ